MTGDLAHSAQKAAALVAARDLGHHHLQRIDPRFS
jgi:hypothetical protein